MNELLKSRFEILFAYDVKDGNPNGDPLDENKPRLDERLNINLVSDVRLKRTIRDELQARGKTLWVSGEAVSSEKRVEQILEMAGAKYESKEQVLEVLLNRCIDLRLFGGTLPLKLSKKGEAGEGASLTGPVQFRMGRSAHKVSPVFIQGTAAFISNEKAKQRSFREEWLLPYSLIMFYGVANQNTAEATKLTEDDVHLMFDAMWNGTKNLITRSKMEQLPRLLLAVKYRQGFNLHIGELDKYIKVTSEVAGEEIRDISQLRIELAGLKGILSKYEDKIEAIYFKVDDRTILVENGQEVKDLKSVFGRNQLAFLFDIKKGVL